ncbi:hypothetical protein [Novosphingobium sp.]|uniref:hypothetical protein n=1 Tax=Novosphingobium sp. TaxID=1874826 RepID=UPI00286DF915|nr:hypothetical protein [Novosphingobium sp.]
MSGPDNGLRAALLAGCAFALAPSASAENVARAPSTAAFSAPAGPIVLTRELRRTIGKSKQIITRRSYEIRFVPEGTGWRVDGTLISSEVDAPAELAELAALEKARKDVGLFPLTLDSQGLIVAQRAPTDAVATDKARIVANKAVEKIDMTSTDKTVAKQMIQTIATQSQASGGNWPIDLFRPPADPVIDVRNIPLPGGNQGRVTVTMQARSNPEGGLRHFDRRILTEIGGTSRLSEESWSMTGEP